jgi:phosphotriesterase-related protein
VALINTVGGPLDTAQLGFTLMHEHVVSLDPGLRQVWPELFDRAGVVQQARDALRAAGAAGVDTLVDLTTMDLGRDAPLLEEIVRDSGVQVVMATGIWLNVPRHFHLRPPDLLARLFVRDITEGIQGSGIKAAIIKVASNDPRLSGPAETVFRAAARAHRLTGVPISTHTDSQPQSGLDQQRVFAEEGVDLSRVIVGHSGDTEDLDYLERLLERGSYLGMDRFGLDHLFGQTLLPTDRRVQVIAALCRRGYAERMVLSHDASGYSDARDAEYTARTWPNWRYTHIPRDVVPQLRAAGVSEAHVERMKRLNPRAIFERQGAY